MNCEILLQPNTSSRGTKMLQAMIDTAPIPVRVTKEWRGKSQWLMSYGLGHVGRRPAIDAHLKKGGRLIGWDLGYWDRDVPHNFKMRLTIDADHPWRRIRPMPGDRFTGTLRNDYDPDGHIILVGQGRKQRKYQNTGRGPNWEQRKLETLNGRVLYRPKVPGETLGGLPIAGGTIEEALRGASLVVCSHSNVAVDACFAGIPVDCEDGAAYALYRDNPVPNFEQRLEFLKALAWWQWSPPEAADAWQHIIGELTIG